MSFWRYKYYHLSMIMAMKMMMMMVVVKSHQPHLCHLRGWQMDLSPPPFHASTTALQELFVTVENLFDKPV